MPITHYTVCGGEDDKGDVEGVGRFTSSRIKAAKSYGATLQEGVQRAKQVSDHRSLLMHYSKLRPVVEYLEEARATGLPFGLSLQLLQRGIELAQEGVDATQGNSIDL